MKIFNINIYSFSLSFQNYEYEIENNWYVKVAKYIKENFPNIDIECLTPETKYQKLKELCKENLKIKCFPSVLLLKKDKEISFQLISYINDISRKENVLLHIHSLKSYLTYSLPILFKNYPIIIQDHGQSPPRGLNRKLIERISFKNIDKFFILTKKYENYLKKFIPEDRILFQPMGVDTNVFKPLDKQETRRILGFESNKKILLFIGSLTKKKNVQIVIKALKEVLREFPDILFYIVGSGEEEKNLKKLSIKNNLMDNIRFCGQVENEKLPLYYSAADLFILPSFYEGFGVVKIEALACNCPVLISDSIENRGIINENRNGLIFKSNDEKDLSKKIIYFFKNQNKFQGAHWKDIEKFSWENIAKNTVEIYNELSLKYYKKSIL